MSDSIGDKEFPSLLNELAHLHIGTVKSLVVQLGVSLGECNDVDYVPVKERRQKLLDCWLKVDESATWSKLVDALKTPAVNEHSLAEKIRVKYCDLPSPALDDERRSRISDERAQQLIDEALGKGSLKQRDVVSTLTGLTGSGKTSLLSRLFGKDPPDLYTSTGIAEKSKRGQFLHFLGNTSFELLSHKDILEFLAPLIQAGMTEANVVSLASDLLGMDTSELTTSTQSTFLPMSMPEESPTIQEMIPLVKEANTSKKEMVLELIHMIDTGGQPEFMERMPCLIHNANLAVLVVNLLYGLDEHPPVHFHVKGVAYKRAMASQYSTRQMIKKLATTLQAKRSSHKKGSLFQILVVATHRDCVKGDLKARVDALNRELRDSLLPTYKDKLIMSSADQIAFALNLKDPDDDDEKAIEMIRSKVSDKAHALGKVIDIPGSFFMYEQDLLKYAAKEEKGVLSLKECLDVGAGLEMKDEVVQAALVFFHRNNTFLYFREVLPNLVFVRPQIPLDFVNAVVLFSYKVSHGEIGGLTFETVESMKKGIITEEILSCEEMQSKEFSTCFVPGLYELHQAIELSTHTFTLAPLNHKKWSEPSIKSPQPIAVADGKKDQYLMMCLLPPIPDGELCRYIPSSSEMVPLVVKFSNDCVPLGCFGSIISCLLSLYDWEVNSKDDDSPECLYHNIVSLFCPSIFVKVLLVDTVDHIEVYVDEDANCHDLPDVREEIFGAIKKVFDIMHITDSEIDVSPAFLCPCEKVCQPHMASLGEIKSEKYLLCSKKKWKGKPQDKYTMWLDNKSPQASACVPSTSEAPPKKRPRLTGYDKVRCNMSDIITALKSTPGATHKLTEKYKQEGWMAITEYPTEDQLVTLALQRIKQDPNQYDMFIDMLRDISGMDLTVDRIISC